MRAYGAGRGSTSTPTGRVGKRGTLGTLWEGAYQWQVRARNVDGVESPWSSIWSFTVDGTPPTNPTSATSAPPASTLEQRQHGRGRLERGQRQPERDRGLLDPVVAERRHDTGHQPGHHGGCRDQRRPGRWRVVSACTGCGRSGQLGGRRGPLRPLPHRHGGPQSAGQWPRGGLRGQQRRVAAHLPGSPFSPGRLPATTAHQGLRVTLFTGGQTRTARTLQRLSVPPPTTRPW